MHRIMVFVTTVFATLALAACGAQPAVQPTAVPAPAAAEQPAAPAVSVGSLTINDPWVRPVNPDAPPPTPMPDATPMAMGNAEMPGAVNTGGYMVIQNSGAETDYLLAASASGELAGAVELHTVVEENGVMQMRPIERIEIPAGGEAVLKPRSLHIMFIDVKRELKAGDLVPVTLTFEKAGTVEVQAVVRPPMP